MQFVCFWFLLFCRFSRFIFIWFFSFFITELCVFLILIWWFKMIMLLWYKPKLFKTNSIKQNERKSPGLWIKSNVSTVYDDAKNEFCVFIILYFFCFFCSFSLLSFKMTRLKWAFEQHVVIYEEKINFLFLFYWF